jgi:N-acetylmuramoyl-L-alanine amidase
MKRMKRQSKLTKRKVLWAMGGLIFLSVSFTPVAPSMVLVIDAGHGGSDPGNLGTGRYKATEKSVTLDVALLLRDYITERFPDVEIVMTRDGDTYPKIRERVKLANNINADLFISIHCDAFTNQNAIGSSTFVMGMDRSEESLRVSIQENSFISRESDYEAFYEGFKPDDPDTYIALSLRQSIFLQQSLELGSLIQSQFKQRVGRKDRGVRQAGYYVTCFTQMPSVLVELGFLTNPKEEEFLNSKAGQELMASALLRAFRTYKEKYHPRRQSEEKEAASAKVQEKTNVLPNPTFRVQIMTAGLPLKEDDEKLQGLPSAVEYLRNGLYKYAVGNFAQSTEANALKMEMQKQGFSDAFVVKFEGTSFESQGVKPIRKN